ncbi:hypothetical protein [Hydrogenimonas sp. SS33]|uniref:hypothetical protein n=1 Tax=Hydrogenimonas leucolamina TaxID=2954236 RepID=UPI00336BC7E8
MKRVELTKEHYEKLKKRLRNFHKNNPMMDRYHLQFDDDVILHEIEKFTNLFETDSLSINKAADLLSRMYLDHNIPFAILSDDLDIIKDTLISTVETERIEEFNEFFKALKNSVAYRFLKVAAKEYKPIVSV